jgi:regulator of nonsense transcripts 2
MDVMAILLASLKRYHRAFVIDLMDYLFEEIIRSCERNDFKESQRRIAMIKFVGECYNFKVIHTSTLFDLLYRLMNINFMQEDFFNADGENSAGQLEENG